MVWYRVVCVNAGTVRGFLQEHVARHQSGTHLPLSHLIISGLSGRLSALVLCGCNLECSRTESQERKTNDLNDGETVQEEPCVDTFQDTTCPEDAMFYLGAIRKGAGCGMS